MDAVLFPLIAHELEYLLPLLEVEILLRCHNVDALVEVVVLLAVYGGCDVSRYIEAGAVGFCDHGRAESVRFEIDYLSAL